MDNIINDDKVTLKEYKFDGWFSDEEFETPFNLDTFPRYNITLFAKYSLISSKTYARLKFVTNQENVQVNEIVGFIGFWIKFEQAEITKVSIAKKFQGHKLSKLLMQDAEKRIVLAGCVNITLEVRVSNEIAINLYKSCGFRIVTTRKKYYENGEDAYLMLKDLYE